MVRVKRHLLGFFCECQGGGVSGRQCVCDRRSQVKAIYLSDKIRVRGSCAAERVLWAAFHRVAMAWGMKSEEAVRATSQP